MIRLIFRELKKHKLGLFLLLLFWGFSGYYIYKYRHVLPVHLSFKFLSLPDPGTQNPKKAYFDYILPAEEIIAQTDFWCSRMPSALGGCTESEMLNRHIHMDLMERACGKFTGRTMSKHNPHWLETVREWNLIHDEKAESIRDTVDPSEYWNQNNDAVLQAFEKLIQATNYAWEIPPDIREDGNPQILLVAELITKYSRALCREDQALMAWGDYISFMELRAGMLSGKNDPDARRKYIYPAEKELFSLKSLKNDKNYLHALREYSAGSSPESLLFGCRNAPMSLVCSSPDEAIKVLNKMIYFSRGEDLPALYIKLAKLHMLSPSKELRKKSLDYLAGAEKFPAMRKEALNFTIRYYIGEGDIKNSYQYLAKLKNLLPDGGRYDPDYRRFAKSVLMKDGRHKDADCFSDKSETPLGIRSHCRDLNI